MFQDILKKNGFNYKGRVDLDQCKIIDLEDGKGRYICLFSKDKLFTAISKCYKKYCIGPK